MLLKGTKNSTLSIDNEVFKRNIFLLIILNSLFIGCTTYRYNRQEKQFITSLNATTNKSNFNGLLVVDYHTKDTIINYNAHKYFIPASTVKLFTLYTSLEYLDDYLPALKYSIVKDTISVLPTGYATTLHPNFKDSIVLEFLEDFETIKLLKTPKNIEPFGPGWAWEDYSYAFSAERNDFALYGNTLNYYKNGEQLLITPKLFKKSIKKPTSQGFKRIKDSNIFYVDSTQIDTLHIPFKTSDSLNLRLLKDIFPNKKITLGNYPSKTSHFKTLNGIPRDSVLKYMLEKSDNLLAEQLMLMSAATLSDTLDFNRIKKHVLDYKLNQLKQPPRWVDGSGLSRYNLFTPESMVTVLDKLYKDLGESKLFQLLPPWNVSDTQPAPMDKNTFIYAKTGSMGNTYNLCGYVKTKKGKILLFSYMNNHFMQPNAHIKLAMYNTLLALHLNN